MIGPVEGPADLTSAQRKYLHAIRKWLETPPTLAALCQNGLPAMAVLVSLLVVAYAVLLAFDLEVLAQLAVGFAIGYISHTLLRFRVQIHLWPASQAIIDRARLEKLLDEPPGDTNAVDRT